MPRPVHPRRVSCRHSGRGFRPMGPAAAEAGVRRLGIDELEAIRLADVVGLYQEAAAEQMGVSRSTFGRILSRGRRAVAEAVLDGHVLLVGGGEVVENAPAESWCPVHDRRRRRGRGCRCPNRMQDDDAGGR